MSLGLSRISLWFPWSTPQSFWWGCAAQILRPLPYFRPRFVIFLPYFGPEPKIFTPFSDHICTTTANKKWLPFVLPFEKGYKFANVDMEKEYFLLLCNCSGYHPNSSTNIQRYCTVICTVENLFATQDDARTQNCHTLSPFIDKFIVYNLLSIRCFGV